MSQSEKFRDEINTGYSFKGDALLLGTAILEDIGRYPRQTENVLHLYVMSASIDL